MNSHFTVNAFYSYLMIVTIGLLCGDFILTLYCTVVLTR